MALDISIMRVNDSDFGPVGPSELAEALFDAYMDGARGRFNDKDYEDVVLGAVEVFGFVSLEYEFVYRRACGEQI